MKHAASSLNPTAPAEGRLWRTSAAVLDANWTHGHTVPASALYPHQWSWDAGFIAVGLAHHNPRRAWQDLRSLFRGQWPDGRVPHIVFDPGVADRDYFPGPAFWNVPALPGRPAGATTGMVQPPVHALAAWEVYQHQRRSAGSDAAAVRAARDELSWLYPRLVAQQRYLAGQRDVGGAGLVSIVHPWESGQDNSPAWDAALAGVPVDLGLLRRHHRRDIQVAVVEHRPTDEDYARYVALAESYRDGGYSDAGLADRHPFLVECPAFNAIHGAAEHALARIAEVAGADPTPHRDRAAAITQALVTRLYRPATPPAAPAPVDSATLMPADSAISTPTGSATFGTSVGPGTSGASIGGPGGPGMFHALDVRTGAHSPVRHIGGLVPLILPDLPAAQVRALVAQAESAAFGLAERMALPLPSYDRTAADFDPQRYWRGPIWININWLLWRGLRTHGYTTLAAALRARMLELIEESGCYEYFHPITGAGIGSPAFSWTAALALDLLAADRQGEGPSAAR